MTHRAILLSGGMDSFALTYLLRPEVAITLDYGQLPAKAEVSAASRLAERLRIQHKVFSIDLRSLGSGDLTDRPAVADAPTSDWWPFRNQALITVAAMAIIGQGVEEICIATVSSDSCHKDGSSEFITSMDKLLRIQEGALRLTAPAMELSTAELVSRSGIPYSLLAWSHSCHTSNLACGQCRGCAKHRTVVGELGYAEV
jgi:7-cyano-7-deazaguanine synthase